MPCAEWPLAAMFRALSYQWLATVYVGGLSFLLSVYVARVLGAEQFGIYSYVIAIASLVMTIQDGGFRTLLFRELVSKSPNLGDSVANLSRAALGHNLFISILALGIISLLPLFHKWIVILAILCFALIVVSQLVSAELKGRGHFRSDARVQITGRTITAIVIVAVLTMMDIPGTASVFAGWSAGLILVLVFAVPKDFWSGTPLFPAPASFYRACLAFVIIDAATAIYFRIDAIMLRHLTGSDSSVGYYSAAYRILEAFIFLLAPIAQVFFRKMRVVWSNGEEIRKTISHMLVAMFLIALVEIGIGYAIGGILLKTMFGSGYSASVQLLPSLLLGLIFIAPNYVLTQGAIALNKEWHYAGIAVMAAIFNVLANYWSIPRFGTIGAVWTTVATEALLFILLAAGVLIWSKGKA